MTMKLLLLDKDGTLINPKSGAKFVNQPWDQAIIPGVPEAIDRYVQQGWKPVIISNQGGIGAGHKTLEATIAEMLFCFELLPQLEEAYFCPDFEGIQCWQVWGDCSEEYRIWHTGNSAKTWELGLRGLYRKPNPGMLKLAIDIHGADEALFVGDRPEDEQAAQAASIPFMWAEDWRN